MSTRKRRKRRRRHVRPGTEPGTILVDGQSPTPKIDVIQFDREQIERFPDVSADEIPPLKDDAATWINIVGLGNKDIIEQIADRFCIHDLAVEDVVNTHQRPKLEEFDDHLYIVLRLPRHDGSLDLEQISIFIGQHYVLTWHECDGDCFEPIRERLETPNRRIRQHGSDYLAYTLIDTIIDSYFPLIIEYGDSLDEVEDQLASISAPYTVIQNLHSLRSDIRRLRRIAWSHRDVIRSLAAYDGDLLGKETRFHLRDVADHTLQLVELLESGRDSCSDLQDLYMSSISLRMNEVMKVLTIIATIFIPMTFIAGLYGMNFEPESSPWNMPETQWYFGYPIALLLMFVVAVGMLVFFRTNGWIGSEPSKAQGAATSGPP